MKFKTSLNSLDVSTLIGKHSFIDCMFLILRGSLPTQSEAALLDATLVACLDNGLATPSMFIPRVVTSTGNSVNAALAAGVLAIGDNHGGAAEACADILVSSQDAKTIVQNALAEKKLLAGFGHKVYKDVDPRVTEIVTLAKKLGFTKYFEKAFEIEKELAVQKGKKLPLNIDGALAVALLELGFDKKLGKAFFIISRLIGMSAHILEESRQNNSYYRLDKEDII